MTTTLQTITDEQIAALSTEAASAGDLAQVAICTRALNGDESARLACARVIAAADAQQEQAGDGYRIEITYTLFDGDPAMAGGSALPDATDVEIEADSLDEAIEDVRTAMEVYAAGLQPEEYAEGDRLYALVYHDGGTERLTHTITAEDLGA